MCILLQRSNRALSPTTGKVTFSALLPTPSFHSVPSPSLCLCLYGCGGATRWPTTSRCRPATHRLLHRPRRYSDSARCSYLRWRPGGVMGACGEHRWRVVSLLWRYSRCRISSHGRPSVTYTCCPRCRHAIISYDSLARRNVAITWVWSCGSSLSSTSTAPSMTTSR